VRITRAVLARIIREELASSRGGSGFFNGVGISSPQGQKGITSQPLTGSDEPDANPRTADTDDENLLLDLGWLTK